MTGSIFLLQSDRQLVRMNEAAYDSEDLLQSLLEDYPDLLAGEQIDSENPRRWLLVRREVGIPGEADGGARWSVDHVFLDQEAIPTLIEVKRSTDTRIRREVVGQMLDYAANAVVYWPVDKLRAEFERDCEKKGRDASTVVQEFIGPEREIGDFWVQAKTNLQAGKVRLIFVADEIPNELQRIIEFLNGQMDPAVVLGVEIKKYAGGNGLQTLVSRVVGQTAEAERKGKSPREERQWTEELYFAEYASRHPAAVLAACRRIHDRLKLSADQVEFGRGKKDGNLLYATDGKRGFFNLSRTVKLD